MYSDYGRTVISRMVVIPEKKNASISESMDRRTGRHPDIQPHMDVPHPAEEIGGVHIAPLFVIASYGRRIQGNDLWIIAARQVQDFPYVTEPYDAMQAAGR